MKIPSVYVERGQKCLVDVFVDYGWEVAPTAKEADIIVLMGGADINPQWYHQIPHRRCHAYDEIWDRLTSGLINHAFTEKKPIIGICRGAQMINAVVGGSMYQDVNNHDVAHQITDLKTGQRYFVNSIHHQMMIPHKSAELVAVASDVVATERHYMDGAIEKVSYDIKEPEPEVLWYGHVNALCFQSHPEYAQLNSPTRQYFYNLLGRFYGQYERKRAA